MPFSGTTFNSSSDISANKQYSFLLRIYISHLSQCQLPVAEAHAEMEEPVQILMPILTHANAKLDLKAATVKTAFRVSFCF